MGAPPAPAPAAGAFGAVVTPDGFAPFARYAVAAPRVAPGLSRLPGLPGVTLQSPGYNGLIRGGAAAWQRGGVAVDEGAVSDAAGKRESSNDEQLRLQNGDPRRRYRGVQVSQEESGPDVSQHPPWRAARGRGRHRPEALSTLSEGGVRGDGGRRRSGAGEEHAKAALRSAPVAGSREDVLLKSGDDMLCPRVLWCAVARPQH